MGNNKASKVTTTPPPAAPAGDSLTPYNLETEAAVLSSVLQFPDTFDTVSFLSPDDFFLMRHRWIWEAYKALTEKGQEIEFLAVVMELETSKKLGDVGGTAFITGLLNKEYSSEPEPYARIVERLALRRRLIDAAGQIARIAHSEETDIDSAIAKAEKAVEAVGERRASTSISVHSAADMGDELMEQMIKWHANPAEIRGMVCGIKPLDKGMGGFEKRRAYWWGGPPGMGKSSVMAQVARGFAENKEPTLYFSLEMPALEMMLRMACQIARVDSNKVKRGQLDKMEYDRFEKACRYLKTLPIWIDDKARSLQAMKPIARRLFNEHGISNVFVDTLNKVQEVLKVSDRVSGMTQGSAAIAGWALDNEFAVHVAAQLSRAHHNSADKRPRLHDLRESGSQEQDADGALFVYRETYYKPEKTELANIMEIIIRKNRYGEADYTIPVYWNPTWPGIALLPEEDAKRFYGKGQETKVSSLDAARQKLVKKEALKPTGTEG